MSYPAPSHSIRPIRRWICIALTVLVFTAACCFPGWMRSGLAIAVTAVVGLIALLVHAVVNPRPRITIRRLLAAAALAAFAFMGWNFALRKVHARVAMVRQLSASNSHYQMNAVRSFGWVMGDDGLMLPEFTQRWIGEGAVGSVKSLVIPAELFTSANLRAWPIDDLEHICVRTAVPTLGQTLAAEKLEFDSEIWTSLSRAAPRLQSLALPDIELKTVDWPTIGRTNLEWLEIVCGSRPIEVPKAIEEFHHLRGIYVREGVVTSHILRSLSSMPRIENFTVFSGAIGKIDGPPVSHTLKTATFDNVTISKPLLDWLSKCSSLHTVDIGSSKIGNFELERFKDQRPDISVIRRQ